MIYDLITQSALFLLCCCEFFDSPLGYRISVQVNTAAFSLNDFACWCCGSLLSMAALFTFFLMLLREMFSHPSKKVSVLLHTTCWLYGTPLDLESGESNLLQPEYPKTFLQSRLFLPDGPHTLWLQGQHFYHKAGWKAGAWAVSHAQSPWLPYPGHHPISVQHDSYGPIWLWAYPRGGVIGSVIAHYLLSNCDFIIRL